MKPLRETLITKDKRDWASASVLNKYGITEKDLVGEIKDFPLGLVLKMLELQEGQGNEPNITVFQKNCCADYKRSGFDWSDTEDGGLFWDRVINGIDFKVFFDKYPKYKKYN